MKKRLMALVLVSCMLACIMPVSTAVAEEAGAQSVSNGGSASLLTNREITASGECGANLTWTLYADGELVISGTGEWYGYIKASYAPWYELRAQVTKITVNEGIKRIGAYAFAYCYNAVSASLPESATVIDNNAFYECRALQSVNVPYYTTYIGAYSFYNCNKLSGVSLGAYLTQIGEYAFYKCSSLSDLKFSKSAGGFLYSKLQIGEYAFYSCNLGVLDLPESVKHIEKYTFCNAGITELKLSSETAYIEGSAFAGNPFNIVFLPSSIQEIGYAAFTVKKDSEFIVVYDGTKKQWDAVTKNNSFALVTGGAGKIALYYTVSGASGNFTNYAIDIESDTLTISGNGRMFNFTNGWEDVPWYYNRDLIKHVVIEDGVTSIGKQAFYHFENIAEVIIPESVEEINREAFARCKFLKKARIESRDAVFGKDVFMSTAPDFEIHGYKGSTAEAYAEANGHTFVVIGTEPERKITAWGGCGDNLMWSLYDDGELVISGSGDMTFWVSFSSVPWCSYNSSIKTVTIKSGATSIGARAFSRCESLVSIDIPDSVTSIGDYAFEDCDSLVSIDIPDSVTSIEYSAFSSCESLVSIDIPDSVTSIGDYAFEGCDSLTSIKIPESVTEIGKYAFYHSNSLTKAVINNPFSTFGTNVFEKVNASFELHGYLGSTAEAYAQEYGHTFVELREITDSGECGDGILWTLYVDGELVISGAGDAFEGVSVSELPWYGSSSSVRSVTLDSGVTGISKSALESWDALESFCVSEDNASFCAVDGVLFDKNKTKLVSYPSGNPATSYAIPEGTMSIGDQAFCKAKNLENIVIPSGVETIGNNAFDYCSSLTSIEIPSSVVAILSNPFHECVSLERIEVSTQNSAYSSENGVLFDKQKTKLICYPPLKSDAAYTVPNGVVSVGGLSRCKNLKSIVFPKSVESIDSFALYGASSLEKATVLNANTRFLTHCFYGTAASFELRGHEGSTAKAYAEANGHTFVALPSTAVAGDLDGNYDVNKDDAVYVMMHIFFEDIYPITQDADFNGDGEVNKDDAVYVMMHIFFPDTYPIE